MRLNAHVIVSDNGIAGADNVLVEIFDGVPGAGGNLIGSATISHIDGKSQQSLSIPLDTSHLSGAR